jgi:hypothetical protein
MSDSRQAHAHATLTPQTGRNTKPGLREMGIDPEDGL